MYVCASPSQQPPPPLDLSSVLIELSLFSPHFHQPVSSLGKCVVVLPPPILFLPLPLQPGTDNVTKAMWNQSSLYLKVWKSMRTYKDNITCPVTRTESTTCCLQFLCQSKQIWIDLTELYSSSVTVQIMQAGFRFDAFHTVTWSFLFDNLKIKKMLVPVESLYWRIQHQQISEIQFLKTFCVTPSWFLLLKVMISSLPALAWTWVCWSFDWRIRVAIVSRSNKT